MADLLLGPLLRYVGETEATVWVETSHACEVAVLDRRERTFEVAGHHYALVCLSGLEPAAEIAYEVALDGERRWPAPESPFPPSLIRTLGADRPLRLAFGSCRVVAPHHPPYTLSKDDDERGREVDALVALVEEMRHAPPERWPDALLLVGDQVYADDVSPATERRIAARRATDRGAGVEVADFEEYTWLYRESWADPPMRWLLSTVPSAMIFDDHDVHDDWNTSWTWVRRMRALPWWHERIVGAFMSYWLYQHLGNLAPRELAADELFAEIRSADGDVAPRLREFAACADREVAGTRWSFHRDFGRVRLIAVDSRAGRVLGEGKREMIDESEWRWLTAAVTGDFDHLLIATSLPYLLGPGLHHIEAWNEAVCAGAWGRRAAALGERVREGLDLEHWAAFGDSFGRLTGLLEAVGAGRYGPAPATIAVLSGDVHHAYLAEAAFPRAAGVRSAVVQATSSPFRNSLDRRERRVMRAAVSRPAGLLARGLARAAGVRASGVRWRLVERPTFDNQVGTLELDGRTTRVRIEKTLPADWRAPRLHSSLERVVVSARGPGRRASGWRRVTMERGRRRLGRIR